MKKSNLAFLHSCPDPFQDIGNRDHKQPAEGPYIRTKNREGKRQYGSNRFRHELEVGFITFKIRNFFRDNFLLICIMPVPNGQNTGITLRKRFAKWQSRTGFRLF